MNESTETLATLYVLDQLDRAERADFEARLLRDSELAGLVRELEASLEHSVRTLPAQPPPPRVWRGLEQRLDALEEETISANARLSRSPVRVPAAPTRSSRKTGVSWAAFAGWGIAALVAVSLVTLAVQSLRPPASPAGFMVVRFEPDRSTVAELPARDIPQDPDARFIRLASLAENYWRHPSELPAPPAATGSAAPHRAYAVYDPGSQQGFIAIKELPPLAQHQRYHLWIADASGRVQDAGILPLGELNRGMYSFSVGAPAENATGIRLFVTVEELAPASELVRPRGKVVLGAQSI